MIHWLRPLILWKLSKTSRAEDRLFGGDCLYEGMDRCGAFEGCGSTDD